MKNIKYYLAAALAFSLTLPGCGEKEPVAPGRPDEPDTSVQATLTVSGEGLSEDGSTFFVGASEAASYLNVESNYADWTVKVTDGSTWLKAFSNTTTTGDRARFEVTENAELESRSATVMLSAGEGSKKIEKSVVVKQWGVAPAIDFAPESPVYAAKEGETISVTVGSNVPFADPRSRTKARPSSSNDTSAWLRLILGWLTGMLLSDRRPTAVIRSGGRGKSC